MCPCGAQRTALVLALTLAVVLPLAVGHQSLSQISMSRNVACRIGFGQFCPGPCPHHKRDMRLDMNRNNPAMVVQRGQRVRIRTLRNNHEGGFSRWTLVHVKDMWDKRKHTANVFLWSCGDTGIAKCSPKWKTRDCYYDRTNRYFTHWVTIPKIYPDGVYILGWVWVGGGGTWGFFGDYYDCSYIEIRGGAPLKYQHVPQFIPGKSPLAKRGMCTATVNDIGICWKEPCPGGGMYTKLFKPKPFVNRIPKPLYHWQFTNPYRIPKSNVRVKSMTIWRLRNAKKWYKIHKTDGTKASLAPYVFMRRKHQVTIECEVEGPVRQVTFYIDGRRGNPDKRAPYTIAGDWLVGWKTLTPRYAKWAFNFDYRVTVVSCQAQGYGAGNEAWQTMELSAR